MSFRKSARRPWSASQVFSTVSPASPNSRTNNRASSPFPLVLHSIRDVIVVPPLRIAAALLRSELIRGIWGHPHAPGRGAAPSALPPLQEGVEHLGEHHILGEDDLPLHQLELGVWVPP